MILRCIHSQVKEFIHDPSIYCRVRLDSRHAHNSLVYQSAVHECRVFPKGEVFSHFLDGSFCRVDGSEGGIEGEVEFFLAPCLALFQPRELISISEDGLELEPTFKNITHFSASISVSVEKNSLFPPPFSLTLAMPFGYQMTSLTFRLRHLTFAKSM